MLSYTARLFSQIVLQRAYVVKNFALWWSLSETGCCILAFQLTALSLSSKTHSLLTHSCSAGRGEGGFYAGS